MTPTPTQTPTPAEDKPGYKSTAPLTEAEKKAAADKAAPSTGGFSMKP